MPVEQVKPTVDATGRVLTPGDVVVYMEPRRPYLSMGRLDRFTPKGMWIQPFNVTHGEIMRLRAQVSLVTSDYREVPRTMLREIFAVRR